MDAFPAFFPLADRIVVIAGSGEAAEAKARLFAGSPATVVRIADDWAFQPAAYAGAILVFVASADPAFAEAAAAAARLARAPVNVVDRPELCDFTTPSVIDRGEVVAAIGTGGASPMLATLLRHDIEARVPQGAGRVAALFRTLQDEVRAALPDLNRRRDFLRAALTGPAAEAAMAGDVAGAERLLRDALKVGAIAVGRVQYLPADGPVEWLTLKAVQALAAADVLAVDPGVRDDILDLARRDAERLGPGVDLAALAARGLRVVRLVTGDGWRQEMARLAPTPTEILPVATP